MSKKDLIALADAIRMHNSNGFLMSEPFTSDQLAVLARFCKQQNSAFKTDRWLDYIAGECGPSGGAVKPRKSPIDGQYFPAKH